MRLKAEGISRQFIRRRGESNVFTALAQTDFSPEPGKITVISGHSGSGKSTLLNILAGLLRPTTGRVLLDDADLYSLGDEEISRLRNEHIGLVPQVKSALSALTVLENVLLPRALCRKKDVPGAEEKAAALLERFGIAELAGVMPSELSGGELRRAAIARALLMEPEILLADEPTGDLDDVNTRIVLEAFREEADRGAAVLLVTHDRDAADFGDIRFRMSGGKLERE